MGGFFGVASKNDCVFDLFYGTDYHSHLGTRRAGMAVHDKVKGFDRAIHNIETSNFRPKFDKDILKMEGQLGIGCISDFEPQPLIVRSHLGTYAITTVGKINNSQELMWMLFNGSHSHFLEMSGGDINPTELTAALINQRDSFVEGIRYAQELIRGSMTMMVMTKDGIYAARDRLGRTPVEIGTKEDSKCICFESFSYLNLGYHHEKELGPGEICYVTPESVPSSGSIMDSRHPPMKISMSKLPDMNAVSTWRAGICSAVSISRTSWRESRIPASPMRWGIPMNPECPMPDLLSSTPRPGPGPLCRRSRAGGI